MKDTILCLCDITGKMAQPWLEAGYRAILVDPQHDGSVTVRHNVKRVGHVIDHPVTWEVIRASKDRIAFTAAFPPCTDLAVSGARWFASKAEADPAFQMKAMQVVWQCHVIAEMLGAPWIIENPVSRISTFWRKPDHSFHPWQYAGHEPGDCYTKATMIWSGCGFTMPEIAPLAGAVPDDRIHKAPPGPDRANFRSATPMGFARAVFQANATYPTTAA